MEFIVFNGSPAAAGSNTNVIAQALMLKIRLDGISTTSTTAYFCAAAKCELIKTSSFSPKKIYQYQIISGRSRHELIQLKAN